jgi:hypothetical protein
MWSNMHRRLHVCQLEQQSAPPSHEQVHFPFPISTLGFLGFDELSQVESVLKPDSFTMFDEPPLPYPNLVSPLSDGFLTSAP